ncbi:glycosyltransferase family 25 protein [Rhizobium sp. AG855]|uniref:glycosyltransferase family 25 protein n=1 Tax=Rhizobium sp. AG855 TaxID=2183898 RepID=UPI000E734C71|nr:glycosyltransferase family 25 protein [Rhizobium sp. AG855]RKE84213.1 glycosyl transferase family 25 [Rhizobium sp. AG855]
MRALVINLEAALERRIFQERQLSILGIAHERMPAFDKNADETADTPYWETWERPLTRAERACLLSHQQAWQVVASQGDPILILEDDAILSDQLPALLDSLATATDMDFVTLETRGRKKLLSRRAARYPKLRRLYQDRSGAAAYVLWPNGARKLLAATETTCGLADAVICACYSLDAYQAVPPLAFQSDRATAEQVDAPLETISSISPVNGARTKGNWRHRLRRIRAQLRMGLRQLQVFGRAERTRLSVERQDFGYLGQLTPISSTTTPSVHGDVLP